MDELGIPFGITVDTETIMDGCVSVRERDTMEQIRVQTVEVARVRRRRGVGDILPGICRNRKCVLSSIPLFIAAFHVPQPLLIVIIYCLL